MIEKKIIEGLPSQTGVYLFKKGKEVLYLGKSVNIRARVKSHLENSRFDKKERLIIKQAEKIDYLLTDNEFEALLLEMKLIKKYLPKYNVIWKDGKSYLYIKITIKDQYPKIFLTRKENDGQSLYIGPFSSSKLASSLINDLRYIVPFCMEKKLGKKPCFYSKIGLCQPCPNFIESLKDENLKEKLKKDYKKNIQKLILIFQGKIKKVLTSFYQKMNNLAKKNKFEEALLIREKIFRLEKILHQQKDWQLEEGYFLSEKKFSLLQKKLIGYFPFLKEIKRIEAYDISNLLEKNASGSMVVLENGYLNKKEYRRFKIKDKKNISDFQRINEVLERRFQNSWLRPQVILIDGGRRQVQVVLKVLEKLKIKEIAVLGIAKNPDRLILGKENFPLIRFIQEDPAFDLLRLLRDEAHRFAKKYHLLLRRKDFLV